MTKPILQVIRKSSMLFVPVLAVLAGIVCSGRRETEDPGAELALIAGKMARENDLQSVVFEDLDGDGTREVILVYGPRELLNFDVYYNSDGEWLETPMVNDQGNPREFKGAMLDSIRDQDADRRSEIRVSSRLYDGNSLVKELHWSPGGYQVIGQRTVLLRKPAEVKPAAPGKTAADTAAAAEKPPEQPEPKTSRPLTPEKAVYLIRKGDTVYGLARLFEVSFEELEALNDNQLGSRGLRIGQRINVPTPSRRNSAFTVRIDREDHEVSPGESLTSIARHYGVSVRALMSWNPDLPEDGTIKVGQRLKIHRALVDIKQ